MTDSTEAVGAARPVPYPAWRTFAGFLDRLAEKGVPAQIDRPFIGGSGSSQSQMQTALRVLGLIDESGTPQDRLRVLAATPPEERASLFSELLEDVYGEALALGQDASQGQLDAWFRSRGVSGDTARKAQSFYLALAKAAGVELSPFFKTPRTSTPAKKRTNGRKPAAETGANEHAAPRDKSHQAKSHAHAAVVALLDKLPAPGEPWSRKERDLLVAAFANVVDLFHPSSDSEGS